MNLSGENLGKYEIIERLGQGGMAQVYKAFQPGIERFVAIKVLHSHLAEDGEFVTRFQREAQSLGQLNHRSILRVIDFEEADGTFFLVMDFIRGRTLQGVLKQNSQLPIAESLEIVGKLADALDYAHSKGTVHRDIKPANIMFSDDTLYNPVLTDFGIARLLDNATLTMSGAIAGTPAYISPEVAQGEKADGRSDIYSLGVVLYEMITGRPPYTGETPLSIILKQATEPLPPPRELNPDVPLAVEKTLEKALAKLPEDRFQSAGEFRDALLAAAANLTDSTEQLAADEATFVFPKEEARATVEAVITAVSDPKPAAANEERTASRPAWLPYAIGGVVVVVLLIGGFLLFGGGDGPPAEETAVPEEPTAALAAVADAEPTETALPATAEPTATAAIVPSATLPPPTNTPAPTETPLPTATPLPLIVPADQFGDLRYLAPNSFVLTLDRVPLPRPETNYVLWLEQQGALTAVADLPVVDNLIRFELTSEAVRITDTLRVVITEQPLDVDEFELFNVRYEGQLPPAYADTMQSLFVIDGKGDSLLGHLRTEAQTAVQHAGLMNQELAGGNLDEAKRHAEHVVNILAGEASSDFGDLNLDGQAQNPGNGTGVTVYFAQLDERLAAAVAGSSTVERDLYQAAAAGAIARGQADLASAISAARRVTSADTAEEATPIGAEVALLLARMIDGAGQPIAPISDGMGGLETAVANSFALASLPIFSTAQDLTLTAPDPVAHFVPGRVGLFQLKSDAFGVPNRFLLQMHNLPPTPPDNAYAAWLVNPTSGEAIFLTTADLNNGRLFAQGDLPQPYPLGFSQIAISYALAGQTPSAPEPLIFSGELEADVENGLAGLFDVQNGTLTKAVVEYQLALDHAALMQNALQGGDLAEGQRHTEHVVNILEGESGANFGDLNGDGQPQNPGDGIGVRVYLAESALGATDAFTPNQLFQRDRLAFLLNNATNSEGLAVQIALELIAAESLDEALPLADSLLAELAIMRDGRDQNADGLVDRLRGEGGITAVFDAAYSIVEMSIFPSNSSTMARFTLVKADDPDKIGVVEAKPMFGAPAATNPFYCPLLPPAEG